MSLFLLNDGFIRFIWQFEIKGSSQASTLNHRKVSECDHSFTGTFRESLSHLFLEDDGLFCTWWHWTLHPSPAWCITIHFWWFCCAISNYSSVCCYAILWTGQIHVKSYVDYAETFILMDTGNISGVAFPSFLMIPKVLLKCKSIWM